MSQLETDSPDKIEVWECEGKSVAERQELEHRETLHYQRARDRDYGKPRTFYFVTLTLLALVLVMLMTVVRH